MILLASLSEDGAWDIVSTVAHSSLSLVISMFGYEFFNSLNSAFNSLNSASRIEAIFSNSFSEPSVMELVDDIVLEIATLIIFNSVSLIILGGLSIKIL